MAYVLSFATCKCADMDGKKRSAEQQAGSGDRSLKAVISKRFGSRKTSAPDAKTGKDKTGIDKLNIGDISKRVADPLGEPLL